MALEPDKEKWFFPSRFGEIVVNSLKYYKQFFAAYVTISFLSFLPFFIVNYLTPFPLLDIFEVIHGSILDVIVFLTLPTLLIDRKVFPVATLFVFKRFVATAILISIFQFAALLFFVAVFVQINIALVFFGFFPYIFLIFAGFFLVLDNNPNIMNMGTTLIRSFRLVGQSFLPVTLGVINISILMFVPVSVFSFWYFGNHPEMAQFSAPMGFDATSDSRVTENFLGTFQSVVQETGFQTGRIGIHVIIRPLKALFLSFLFLGILSVLSPGLVKAYFTSYQSQVATPNEEEGD